MNALKLPPWPKNIKREFFPIARLGYDPRFNPMSHGDYLALQRARQIEERMGGIQTSGTTGTWNELMFVNSADYTAVASSATEASLLSGVNDQPVIPALFFFNKQGRQRSISILARGILSTTGTPTSIWQVRLGTTSGSAFISGTSVGVTAALTTASGVTNKWWEMRLDLVCTIAGIGTGNTTLAGAGYVTSPGGLASPFTYAMEPTTPDTATWTATIDNSLTQFVNISQTWSSSSSSNTITLKQLKMYGEN